MKSVKWIAILLLMKSVSVFGQNDEPKREFGIEGQIAITTNGKGVFYNMGGPAVKFNLKKMSVAINFMPSLRFQNDSPKLFVTPILGFGPQIYFLKQKRFILSFPMYYNSAGNEWLLTAGVGYVLTKKK